MIANAAMPPIAPPTIAPVVSTGRPRVFRAGFCPNMLPGMPPKDPKKAPTKAEPKSVADKETAPTITIKVEAIAPAIAPQSALLSKKQTGIQ